MSVLGIHSVLFLRAQRLFVVTPFNIEGRSLRKPVREVRLTPAADGCTLVKSDSQALTHSGKVFECMMGPFAMCFDDMGMNNKHITTKIMRKQLLARISQKALKLQFRCSIMSHACLLKWLVSSLGHYATYYQPFRGQAVILK